MTGHVRISISDDSPVDTRIIEAVAALTDTQPPEMTPFYDSVDPDAFDTLFGDGSGECCRFTYDGTPIQIRRIDEQTLEVSIETQDESASE